MHDEALATRRAFLRGSLLIGTGVALGTQGCAHLDWLPAALRRRRRGVDVHCHVFNARDLPIAGFVKNVLLRELGYSPVVAHHVADYLLQSGVPGFDEENGELDLLLSGAARTVLEIDVEPTPEEFEEFLRKIEADDPNGLDRVLENERGVERDALDEDELLAEAERTSLWNVFRWAKLVRQYRFVIAQNLLDTYQDVSLFTPATVDLDFGVDDRVETSLLEQVLLYEKIVLLFEGRLHPMVAFDPLREARHGPGEPGSLALVQEAVEQRGFVGVKLYPPMGFRPYGNADPAVDAALASFYDWAQAEEVPVIAHCNDSNGAGNDFGRMASPTHWETALQQWSELRLDLGHFGGVDDLLANGRASWAAKIAELMDAYPHVYADVGFHRIALEEDERDDYLAWLGALRADHPALDDRLLYGSDWQMILSQAGYQDYFDTYRKAYRRAFGREAAAKFTRENALSYLGFADGGTRARTRLAAFYALHGRDEPEWLPAP